MWAKEKLDNPMFLMCVPKCGTHLIMNILYTFIGSKGMHGFDEKDTTALVNELFINSNELENKIYTGHFWYSKDLEKKIRDCRKIILVRDPRDYVISQAHFWDNFKRPENPIDKYFTNLENPTDRISAVIFGINFHNSVLASTYDIFLNYALKWTDSRSLVIRYEDLVSTTQGRVETKTIQTIKSVLEFIGIDTKQFNLEDRIFHGSNPVRSLTYRSGKTGNWKREFDDQHINYLKISAPKLISALGYETDESWTQNSNETTCISDLKKAGELEDLSASEIIKIYYELQEISKSSITNNMINGWAAKHLLDSGHFEDCLPILDLLLATNPKDPLWNYSKAFCLHQTNKDLQNALILYDAALREGFDEFWVRFNRGSLLLQMNDRVTARMDLEKAYSMQPNHPALLELIDRSKKVE